MNYTYNEVPNFVYIQLYTIVTKPQSADTNTLCAKFCNIVEDEVNVVPNFKWADVQTVRFMNKGTSAQYLECHFMSQFVSLNRSSSQYVRTNTTMLYVFAFKEELSL